MRISCLMMTYNKFPRAELVVAEAIESFLRQTYDDKELIILNDTPGQTVRLNQDYENIKLVNLPYRIRSLGEKCNIAAAVATGDYLMRWDDDDISLPWRMTTTMAKIGSAGYWKPSHSWFMRSRSSMLLMCGYMGACCIHRQTFDKIQGYPFIGVGEDQAIEKRVSASGDLLTVGAVTAAEAFYIYRWDGTSSHVSGAGNDGYELFGTKPIETGQYEVRPRWATDYEREVSLRVSGGLHDETTRLQTANKFQRSPGRHSMPVQRRPRPIIRKPRR